MTPTAKPFSGSTQEPNRELMHKPARQRNRPLRWNIPSPASVPIAAALIWMAPHCLAAGGAHVHGAATADVVVDGPLLQIEFSSPLENLVGFEHAPRTARQKQAVQAMTKRFAEPGVLFKPNAEAGCKAEPATLDSPWTTAARPEKSGAAHDGHSELHASITFHCASPAALKTIDFPIFDAFPSLERLSVQLAGPRGQSAATLKPKRRVLSW